MHKSKIFLLIGIVMFIIMVVFILYALQHPEGSFAFNVSITYMLYLIYFAVMIAMFILAATNRNK
jgi:hypothetical protein